MNEGIFTDRGKGLARHQRRRTAMTLIEVIAALIIMGGAVSGMLLVQARNLEQLTRSQFELAAHHVAKGLMIEWRLREVDVTVPEGGQVGERVGWHWKRSAKKYRVTDDWNATEVTLEIRFLAQDNANHPSLREYKWLVNDAE